ncbi:MAG: O-acetyl-ADP-ribose deacetylase [Methanosarcinales archaeon]|nr:O-acetyl-ADP-ribose deacetylase [Methanosarcinales archaeon]
MIKEPITYKISNTVLYLVLDDITDQNTDAIVNAANSTLMGGGGVDGAIHYHGGPEILKECKKIRRLQWPDGLPTSKTVITTGGNLKACYVIHTVGPIWNQGSDNEPELLREAYINSLDLAVENGIQSISFPSISTGAYGYPIHKAARVVLQVMKNYLPKVPLITEVRLVLFKLSDLGVYQHAAEQIL